MVLQRNYKIHNLEAGLAKPCLLNALRKKNLQAYHLQLILTKIKTNIKLHT